MRQCEYLDYRRFGTFLAEGQIGRVVADGESGTSV